MASNWPSFFIFSRVFNSYISSNIESISLILISIACFFFEIGIEDGLRIEATFVGHAFNGELPAFLCSGNGLEGFNPVFVDEYIKIHPENLIKHP